MDAIVTDGITRSFDGFVAVDGVSITVGEGELFGLLGPNRAQRIYQVWVFFVTSRPTSGTARVCGFDVVREAAAVRSAIGVVFQGTTLDDHLTGRENLDFHGRLYGMAKKLRRDRIAEVLRLVELGDKADLLVKTYSGGMMRRLEIARGLMHHPKVLFLDEPTLGLDPQTRFHIWEYIRSLNREEGVTMMLTTHYMEEADALCDRIAIIDQGRITALDRSQQLKNALGGDIITLRLANSADGEKLLRLYEGSEYVSCSTITDSTVYLTVDRSDEVIPLVFQTALGSDINIQSVTVRKPTLDDVFVHHTGRGVRDEVVNEFTRVRYKLQTSKR